MVVNVTVNATLKLPNWKTNMLFLSVSTILCFIFGIAFLFMSLEAEDPLSDVRLSAVLLICAFLSLFMFDKYEKKNMLEAIYNGQVEVYQKSQTKVGDVSVELPTYDIRVVTNKTNKVEN